MDEKDKQIERLFDDYASELPPNIQLASRAKQKLRDKHKAKKPIFWVGIASAAAAASAFAVGAVAITVFSLSSIWGGNGHTGNGSDHAEAPAVHSYSISDIKAVSVDAEFAKNYIDVSGLDSAEVFSQSYYACYLKGTDEFVYLKAVLGVGYNDGSLQMSIVAEKPEYSGEERTETYGKLAYGTNYRYHTEYVKGEYITLAYCKTEEYKYYVSAMGNADGAQDIAQIIIKKNN